MEKNTSAQTKQRKKELMEEIFNVCLKVHLSDAALKDSA